MARDRALEHATKGAIVAKPLPQGPRALAVAKALRRAYAVIQDEARWCHGWAAKPNGDPCWIFHESAVSWSAIGAICVVTRDENALRLAALDAVGSILMKLWPDAWKHPGNLAGVIDSYNDKQGHRATLDVLRRTIETLEAQAGAKRLA